MLFDLKLSDIIGILTPMLRVSKLESLYDEHILIQAEKLPPQEIIHIKLKTIDRAGLSWSSHAFFLTDDKGCIDLSVDPPQKGSYTKAHSMGLFYSLEPQGKPKESTFFYLPEFYQTFELTLHLKQHVINQVILKRALFNPNKTLMLELSNNDFRGVYFAPKTDGPHPTVLILGGSEGGLNNIDGALLASHGIASLSLSYFGCEGQPSELVNIPLECVDSGIMWLIENSLTDKSRIFIMGTSRGSELTILTVIRNTKLFRGMILVSPSAYVWSGLTQDESTKPSWTLRGEARPFIEFDFLTEEITGSCPSYLSGCLRRLNQLKDDDPARLPIEKVDCKTLIISGDNDLLWASSRMGTQLESSLKAAGLNCEQISYSGAGHLIWIPFRPTHANKYTYQWGGNFEADAAASESSWQKKIEFILSV